MTEYIVFFIVSLITIFAVLLSFKKTISEKIHLNFWVILYLIVGSIITTILSYIGQPLLKNVFTMAFFVFIFKINSTKQIKELIYYAFIIWIYGLAIDFVNMIVVSLLGLPNIFNMIYVRTGAGIVISTLLVVFCSIPPIKKFTNKMVEILMKIKRSIFIDIILILILILLSALCFLNINEISTIFPTVFISLLLILFMYLVLTKNYNINRLKEVNSILIKNNEFFVKLDSDYRVLKHNLTNQLIGLKSVSNEKTKKLIDDLITSYNSNFVSSRDIHKIPGGINGIIYEKFYSFNKKDIRLAVDNTINNELVDVVSSRTFNNLCEILGVLIDNALEAASESAEKVILIDFSENKNYITIHISNTFNNEIDIDKIGERSYSTKGKNHGIGLFSIFRKNDIKVKNKVINNLFQTELKIKKVII